MPLAPLTTLQVGGPARFFVETTSERDIKRALEFAASESLPVIVLGGGSNILVSDAGFDGLVIRICLKGIVRMSASDSRGRVLVTAQAGEVWDDLVEYAVEQDLAGLECLSGIPGLVGGTPIQNVGAYGQEVSETLVAVRCRDRESGRIVTLSAEDCAFSYRGSVFNSTLAGRYIVLSVSFALQPGGPPKLVYKDLREHFQERPATLAEARAAVLDIRRAKSMVIDPTDPNSRSAGSFFKNPIVEGPKLSAIAAAAGTPAVPHFDAGGGMVKVPAAWLIENAGFYKGYALGNAGISSKHALALVNRGGASAADIVRLKDEITAAVRAKFAIDLAPEPIFIGF